MSEVRPDEGLRGEQLPGLGRRTISSYRDGARHTIGLLGELDLATAEELQHELQRAETSDAQSIVLDLSGPTRSDAPPRPAGAKDVTSRKNGPDTTPRQPWDSPCPRHAPRETSFRPAEAD